MYMGYRPGHAPAGIVPCSRPFSRERTIMLLGICPHNPKDFFIGSKVTSAAVEVLFNKVVDVNFPPAVLGMLPLKQLPSRLNSRIAEDMDESRLSIWVVKSLHSTNDPSSAAGPYFVRSLTRADNLCDMRLLCT